MRRPSPPALSDLQHRILTTLGRVGFATEAQLAYWGGVQVPAVSKALAKLVEARFVVGEAQVRPVIFRLTHAGARVARTRVASGRRYPSWSVMAHAGHTNQTEIALRARYPGLQFFDRLTLLKQGFNPAFGEHAGVDAGGVSSLVLVDDYLMGSERISRVWTRRHRPARAYWPAGTGREWREVVQRFIVATTDGRQAEAHTAWITDQGIPADVMTIKALWR